jgi:hypothetical protein
MPASGHHAATGDLLRCRNPRMAGDYPPLASTTAQGPSPYFVRAAAARRRVAFDDRRPLLGSAPCAIGTIAGFR